MPIFVHKALRKPQFSPQGRTGVELETSWSW